MSAPRLEVVVQGIAFGGFTGDALVSASFDEFTARGNHFGTGLSNEPNWVASSDTGISISADTFATIGGMGRSDRIVNC